MLSGAKPKSTRLHRAAPVTGRTSKSDASHYCAGRCGNRFQERKGPHESTSMTLNNARLSPGKMFRRFRIHVHVEQRRASALKSAVENS